MTKIVLHCDFGHIFWSFVWKSEASWFEMSEADCMSHTHTHTHTLSLSLFPHVIALLFGTRPLKKNTAGWVAHSSFKPLIIPSCSRPLVCFSFLHLSAVWLRLVCDLVHPSTQTVIPLRIRFFQPTPWNHAPFEFCRSFYVENALWVLFEFEGFRITRAPLYRAWTAICPDLLLYRPLYLECPVLPSALSQQQLDLI